MPMIRKEFFAYGRVQGVGFRFYIATLASSYNLTGFAKNLTDGSVQIQLQGDILNIAKVKSVILKPYRFILVENLDEKKIPVIEETGFSIL